jgi:TonB-dependent receptor
MRSADVRPPARSLALTLASIVVLAATPASMLGQGQTGTVAGHVVDSAGAPLAADISVIGNARFGVYAGADGSYAIPQLPAGDYRLQAHFIGFKPDTFSVTVTAGQTTYHRIVLREDVNTLKSVVVSSPRLNETTAGALQEQKDADNIVTVMSGDEIRALPNANAAEALARLPGVTAERDEGEGKYVEIRGTPPDFQHVTIDGADVPGTLATDVRAVKLDDVPADLLGAIEVTKTLTADQDARAIGGSVNLVTKVPEGAPHGYFAGNYAYQSLQSTDNGQADVSYGGRVGDTQKFGFLMSGTYNRTNRTIDDVEPSYGADFVSGGTATEIPNGSGFNHIFPNQWSERDYNYYRTRYGLGGDLDYRFSPTSSVYVKGLWSAFFDEANRWETSIGGGTDAILNGVPTVEGASAGTSVSNRGPIEHTWGFSGGGKQDLGNVHLSYSANYAGSQANQHDHFQDDYNPIASSSLNSFNYTYNNSRLVPTYNVSPQIRAAIANPAQYALGTLETDNELNSGQTVGAKADALVPFQLGSLPASFKFGAKISNEHKGYLSFQPQYDYTGANPLLLSAFPSTYSNPGFYKAICSGCYALAPYGNMPPVNQYYLAHQNQFTEESGQVLSDNLATFAGTEQVAAVYAMQTLDVQALHINVGLRLENTNVGYAGHATVTPSDTVASTVVHGTSNYTDLFPSLQLRYALDDNTNLRAAVTKGIARPDYIELAPSLSAQGAQPGSITTGITVGNPDLKPEYAWNFDLLAEHYFSSVGELSGGLFYKDIYDFIFQRTALYTGSLSQYHGYYATEFENGPSAHLWGAEADYTQHLVFLPGAFRGLGFDLNYTHVESRAIVPIPGYNTTSYTGPTGATIFPYANTPTRIAPLPRQFPNMFNVALLYDYSPVSARLAGQYTSASVFQYGTDGTSNPESSDVYNYAHWQIDGQLTWVVRGETALTAQVLNLNNEVFGFFTGTTAHPTNNQREYYGTTVGIGIRQGF